MRTDACIKPHTLRDTVTGRNRNRKKQHMLFISKMAKDNVQCYNDASWSVDGATIYVYVNLLNLSSLTHRTESYVYVYVATAKGLYCDDLVIPVTVIVVIPYHAIIIAVTVKQIATSCNDYYYAHKGQL